MDRARRYLAGTKVATPADRERENEILGFYTILFHQYRDGELTQPVARKLGVQKLHGIPMLLLAQLGVRADLQNKGLGRTLMREVMERGLQLGREVSSVALITDPIDERAAAYYKEQYGFAEIGATIAATGQPRLFLPTKTIEAAYQRALETGRQAG